MIGFYEGDIHAGRNALRRFIRHWYPRWQGQDLGAPVSWNHAFTFEARITDEIFRRQVPVCADLGFDWMQIDWGWYAGCIPPMGMTHGIGNWTTVEPTRFPNGIEPLADLVRSYGMKYCTWVDPEQAHHLALVLGELTTNSLKYGRGEDGLQVGLQFSLEDGQVCLVYRDGGAGYPPAVLAGRDRSVGLWLIDSIVRTSLRGHWNMANDGGAVTRVCFPANPGLMGGQVVE